ncbi:hypothetical protein [Actinoallomurus sp. CA-150999]|uniref:hypothetical protein n=1 Tax=Actinoallomurus sp. CA-150999 TaxID=3239887 RepID=UPI003D8E86E9
MAFALVIAAISQLLFAVITLHLREKEEPAVLPAPNTKAPKRGRGSLRRKALVLITAGGVLQACNLYCYFRGILDVSISEVTAVTTLAPALVGVLKSWRVERVGGHFRYVESKRVRYLVPFSLVAASFAMIAFLMQSGGGQHIIRGTVFASLAALAVTGLIVVEGRAANVSKTAWRPGAMIFAGMNLFGAVCLVIVNVISPPGRSQPSANFWSLSVWFWCIIMMGIPSILGVFIQRKLNKGAAYAGIQQLGALAGMPVQLSQHIRLPRLNIIGDIAMAVSGAWVTLVDAKWGRESLERKGDQGKRIR